MTNDDFLDDVVGVGGDVSKTKMCDLWHVGLQLTSSLPFLLQLLSQLPLLWLLLPITEIVVSFLITLKPFLRFEVGFVIYVSLLVSPVALPGEVPEKTKQIMKN